MKPAIIVLGFKRPNSLNRLLCSLAEAAYPWQVDLIISLEFNACLEVMTIADNFSAPQINVTVVKHEAHLGLRQHVIECGDYSKKYGSVIILEDDLFVDKYFYIYASQALDFYENSENIAGVALYSFEYNEIAGLPFKPLANGYDTYIMQIPCSWGQCWSYKQWSAFKNWYACKKNSDLLSFIRLPPAVKAWPESSWKKYFYAYMIEYNLNFIYPYQSLSTNCSDAGGTHITNGTFLHQTALALQLRLEPTFKLCPSNTKYVAYDSFMEPVGEIVEQWLKLKNSDIEIDLYGTKPVELLLSKPLSLTLKKGGDTIKSFNPNFRPVEINLSNPLNVDTIGHWRIVTSEQLPINSANTASLMLLSYQSHINFVSLRRIISIFLLSLKVMPLLLRDKFLHYIFKK